MLFVSLKDSNHPEPSLHAAAVAGHNRVSAGLAGLNTPLGAKELQELQSIFARMEADYEEAPAGRKYEVQRPRSRARPSWRSGSVWARCAASASC